MTSSRTCSEKGDVTYASNANMWMPTIVGAGVASVFVPGRDEDVRRAALVAAVG